MTESQFVVTEDNAGTPRTLTNPTTLDYTGKDAGGEFDMLELRTDAATAGDAIAVVMAMLDSTSAVTDYGKISTEIKSATDTSEIGKMLFNLMVDGAASDVFQLNPLSGGNIQAIVNSASTGGDSVLQLQENGSFRYSIFYDPGDARFALATHDSDGGGADTDVIRIPDGQLTVDGNATFDDNAFDWVCGTCYWHSGLFPDAGRCPQCEGAVEWHDDSKLLHDALAASPSLADLPDDIRERMESFGILTQYDDGQVFVSMNRAPIYLMNCAAQLWEKNQDLKGRLDRLEETVLA